MRGQITYSGTGTPLRGWSYGVGAAVCVLRIANGRKNANCVTPPPPPRSRAAQFCKFARGKTARHSSLRETVDVDED